jgi:undecaprenyl-diphosphatase
MIERWPVRFDVYTALSAVVAFAVFVVVAYFAHVYARFPGDLAITRAVQLLRSPAFDTISGALRWTGLPPQSQYIYGACAILLFIPKQRWAAVVIAASAAGSAVLYFFVEPHVSRPRPDEDLVYVAGKLNMGGFPSGHVLIAVSVYGFLIYVAATKIRSTFGQVVAIVPPLVVLIALGVSRIYDGQHWTSDVIGGALLGAAWLILMILIHRAGIGLVEVHMQRHQEVAAGSGAPD